MSRGKFAQWILFGIVFLVGSLTLAQQVGGLVSHFTHGVVTNAKSYNNSNSSTGTGGADVAAAANEAKFDYLVPGNNAAWTVDSGQTAYDPAHAIVKYDVTFVNAKVDASITQQAFPDQLKPRGGDKFAAFINNTKPTRSADMNGGTLYFLPALTNGAPADGTDTVIFARDDVLMFGQSHGILGWDAWSQMFASMRKHN